MPHHPRAPLPADALRWSCDPTQFAWETTQDAPHADLLTHQERPVRALQLSLGMRRLDYNIYVSGPSGLGKTRTITRLVEAVAASRPVPDDWLYVYNFEAPDRPRVLHLPAGKGRPFAASLQAAADRLGEDIGTVLHSGPLTKRRQLLVSAFDKRREELYQAVQRTAKGKGFELNRAMLGPFGLAMDEGEEELLRPLDPRLREASENGKGGAPTESLPDVDEDGPEPTEEEWDALRHSRQEVMDELGQTLWRLQKASDETNQKLDELQREAAQQAITPVLEPLRRDHADHPEVLKHLDGLEADVLNNLAIFLREEGDEPEEGDRTGLDAGGDGLGQTLRRYYANVVIDHTGTVGAPVVAESHPSYANLLGRIEQEAHQGTLSTHFLMVKGGALHRAIGGFLILRAEDLLREPTAWEALKRAIRDGELRIEDPNEGSGAFATRWLRPEGIPLTSTRIILTGTEETLEILSEEDLDFPKLFKVVAQFDDAGPREELLAALPGFVASLCHREGLLHLDRGAVGALAELSVRDSEDQTKLSTRQVVVSDIVREAEHWAREREHALVTADDVWYAHHERQARLALSADRIHEGIRRGHLHVQLTGEVVGQLNGLVVSQLGPDHAFGWPARITTTVGAGERGVLAIEREVNMSGPIFGKAVLIIEGYLRGRYAQSGPLSAVISVVMEQSYTLIEGDSASAAELCAILSALAGVPLDQGVAMTGAVDQFGRMMPIGAVTEKVEGMYRACVERGLSGAQGVIIPVENAINLQLAPRLVADAAAGRFHVYTAQTIDDALAVLTPEPVPSFHARVEARLRQLTRAVQRRSSGRWR